MKIKYDEKSIKKKIFEQFGGTNDIKQISCGLGHTFILKEHGDVFSCGDNQFGQLGLGHDDNENIFQKVPIEEKIIQICCGYDHTIILTENNSLFACGKNDYGELGLGHNENQNIFQKVPITKSIKQISCGSDYTFILTVNDELFSCGHNYSGQLGLKHNTNQNTFQHVPMEGKVKQISCGSEHTIILMENNLIYACGYNKNGNLGLGHLNSQNSFQRVPINDKIIQISCGSNHTFILTENNHVFASGKNLFGQLGLGDYNSKEEFYKVPITKKIKKISCGANYTFLLAEDNDVFAAGYGGPLGLGNYDGQNKFVKVNIDGEIKDIVCGVLYTFILMENNDVFATGNNSVGQLGLNSNINDTTTFQKVQKIEGTTKKKNISCPTFESGGCNFLTRQAESIYNIDVLLYDTISKLTWLIGDYERRLSKSLNSASINYHFDNLFFSKNFYSKMKDIRKDNQSLYQTYNSSNNTITKRIKKNEQTVKTDYNLTDSNVFGTGNLSVSLLLDLKYETTLTPIIEYKSIAKIYPINFSKLVQGDNEYQNIFNSENKRKNLDDYMEYIFMREGMIGCWIKNNLIATNISSAFACIYDSYIMKSLPITKQNFFSSYSRMGAGKKWLSTVFKNFDIIKDVHFGYIEMEKLDMTVRELKKSNKKRHYDLGMIFEILHAKLSLMFFGNVYMMDDHDNNIMVKKVDYIRHYRLKRRDTIYNFYVDNPYAIKYIDFERFEPVTNRNYFFNYQNDVYIKQYLSAVDINEQMIWHDRGSDYQIKNYIATQLENPLKSTINNFCELMTRCLPQKYKTLPITTQQIITYDIDLDMDDQQLVSNFINKSAIKSNLDVPFEKQNQKQNINTYSQTIIGGDIYYEKYLKYQKKVTNDANMHSKKI